MSWLDKLLPPKIEKKQKANIPEGLWKKCASCGATLYHTELEENFNVCPKCNHHNYLSADGRIKSIFDEGTIERIADEVMPIDILGFSDTKKYSDRLTAMKKATGESDALVVASGKIAEQEAVLAVFEFKFIGGSMGSVVGERFVRGVQKAIEKKCPFICIANSGGARMMEGVNSLMQMTKTSAALTLLSRNKLPFISILANPTMGGVSASFAFLGDVVIAEPKASIGFAGKRVIEQTVREKLPSDFQTAEFLLEKGAIDMIVPRGELKPKLADLFKLLLDK